MKTTSLLLGFCLLATGLHAFAPHPSVLTVKYKDQMLPVVKVIGTDPVVLVAGQETRIRTDPIYVLERTAEFGDEYVQLVKASLGGMEFKQVFHEGDVVTPSEGPRFGTSYFEATLKSKNTLKGGFAAVVVYSFRNLAGEASPYNQTEVIVHDLPELPAGQEVPVQFSAAIPNGQANQKYFVQIFDGTGHEALTSHLEPAWQFYTLRDLVQLAEAGKKYQERFAGQDHAAVPVVMARPVFKSGITPPKTAVSAILTIAADGIVANVDVRGVEDADVRQSIAAALGGWLFLPRLKAGVPVATKIQVPLQF